MLKRVLIAGAVGASLFGIAGASASALGQGANNGQVVQQSDALTATCTTNPQWQSVTDGNTGSLLAVRLFQQDFKSCAGDQAQAVALMNDGSKVYSAIDTFDGGGLDTYLTFPANTADQNVKSIQLTVAGDISTVHGTQGVKLPNNYQAFPNNSADNHQAP